MNPSHFHDLQGNICLVPNLRSKMKTERVQKLRLSFNIVKHVEIRKEVNIMGTNSEKSKNIPRKKCEKM